MYGILYQNREQSDKNSRNIRLPGHNPSSAKGCALPGTVCRDLPDLPEVHPEEFPGSVRLFPPEDIRHGQTPEEAGQLEEGLRPAHGFVPQTRYLGGAGG